MEKESIKAIQSMDQKSKIEILDCTIRDGGYVNNWWFEKRMVREVYRTLSKSGVDYVELGFRGTEKNFDPAVYGTWRFTSEKNLQEVTRGIEGAKVALMGDYGKIDLEDLDEKKYSVATMIRIAAHKDKVFDAIGLLGKIKAKGYVTSLQAMGFTSYTGYEKVDLTHAIKNSGLDYFYIADSYGSIFPNEIKALFEPFLDLGTVKVGFHPHDSLQMAFANTLEAMKIGIDIVDSSIYGMGRGSGNLTTEALIAYLETQGNNKYNVIPVLNCVDRYFVDIKKEMPWGYQLPYMISGIFKCHPYYAAELVKRREYSIEDIWKAMEVIQEMNPIGFDRSIIDNLIKQGVVGSLGKKALVDKKKPPEESLLENNQIVPYVKRHTGRDFLVLANGPSLKEYQSNIHAFIEKYNPLTLGANYLSGIFEPDYHAFNNKKRFVMYVDTVSPSSKLLIGENIPHEMISEYVNREYEPLCFTDILDADFDIKNGVIKSNCRTISVLLLGVAIVMGANRIFIAGMDGYMDKNKIKGALYYEEKFETKEYELNVEKHMWNERFLQQIDDYIRKNGGEGIHILTPTSHSAFYKGIDNYIKSEKKAQNRKDL